MTMLAQPPTQTAIALPQGLVATLTWVRWFTRIWQLVGQGIRRDLALTTSGLSPEQDLLVPYVTLGPLVTLLLPDVRGAGLAATLALSSLPLALLPAVDQDVLVRVQEAGNTGQLGLARLTAGSPVLTIYANPAADAFSGTGSQGLYAQPLTYITQESL